MRGYLVNASIALASYALDVQETLKQHIFSQKQGEDGQSNDWTGDFTQANCDTLNQFYVAELPFFDTTVDTWPCSYAGTLPGDVLGGTDDGASNLFFWIYPAIDADAPVSVWLNGGPGASSTFANFLFSSPLRIAQLTDDYEYKVYTTEDTWISKTTMIYIDQPVGTGFSWGGPLLTTMDEASTQFVNLMTNIWTYFPFTDKPLYMTGESYAGKYIPRFSWALHENGSFNLQASLVGDPYTAPLTQRTHMHLVPEALNILDDSNMPQIAALRKNCQEMLAIDLAQADDTCAAIMDYISNVSGGVFAYDQRIFGVDWDPIEDPVTNYFTNQKVSGDLDTIMLRIHVYRSTKDPKFEMSSSAVGEAFVNDNLLDYSSYVEKLVGAGSPVLIYAGEFDAQDGPKTQEFWLRKLNFTGSDDFWSQSRSIYWVQNFTNPETDLINGGLWRTSEYFEYLTVPKAGHFVPNNYFSPSYSFLSDYITGQKLTCHDSDNGCSVVASRCSAMNDCNDQGTCNQSTGQCECNSGYKFADCSKKAIDLSDGNDIDISLHGPMWFSMQYSGTSSSTLYLTPNITSDIYILRNSKGDPNNFVYDMSFKNVTANTTFNADNLGLTGSDGYSIAVYVSAVDEPANELLYGSLNVFFHESARALYMQFITMVALAEIAIF